MEYAKKCNADLLLATDPDCDRVGIAVKNKAGEYELLTGNQTGMLLLDYICSQRIKHGKMPADPVMIKTIVTMDMGEQIAAHYGLRTVNVLTGFKFIGEQIGKLEQLGKSDVLKFLLEDNCSLVVRPSGTEPKLKIYISVSAENKEMAEKVEDEIAKTAEKWIC